MPHLYDNITDTIKLLGAEFQGSNDFVSWTPLAKVDQTVHDGWNSLLSSDKSSSFRYLRMSHNSSSQCMLTEFRIFGILMTSQTVTLSSHTASVTYHDGYNSVTIP